MGLSFAISLMSPFIYMEDMIPALHVTPMLSSFTQEPQTSKKTEKGNIKFCCNALVTSRFTICLRIYRFYDLI